MDPCIHRWVSNQHGNKWRGRNTGSLPRRTESLSKHGRWKALLHCRTETAALVQAASIVQASDHDCEQVVFLSDALSALQAYQNHRLPNLTKALKLSAATRRDVLRWVLTHCGILEMSKRTSSQRRALEENSIATMSASAKRRFLSERSRCQGHRGTTITCCPGSSKSFW